MKRRTSNDDQVVIGRIRIHEYDLHWLARRYGNLLDGVLHHLGDTGDFEPGDVGL